MEAILDEDRPQITQLDTDNILLYKYAKFYDVPTKLIIIRTPEERYVYDENVVPSIISTLQKYQYLSIINEIPHLISEGNSLIDIQVFFNIPYKSDKIIDLIYSYYISIRSSIINKLPDSLEFIDSEGNREYVEVNRDINNLTPLEYLIEMNNYLNSDSNVDTIDLNKIVEMINDLYRENDMEEISDLNPIDSGYGPWLDNNETLKKKEKEILRKYEGTIIYVGGIDTSNITTSKIKFVYIVRSGKALIREGNGKTRDPVLRDGIDLFNFSVPSHNIPYIQFNDSDDSDNEESKNKLKKKNEMIEGEKYYKIYKGDISKKSPDYNVIVPSSSQTSNINTFYMIVWSGVGDIDKATKESFMKISYDLAENKVIIRSPVQNYQEGGKTVTSDQLIVNRIQNAMPINIEYTEELRVGGEFFIYGLEYNEVSFVYFLMFNDFLKHYLYIDESIKSYPFKQRLYLHFRSAIGMKSLGSSEETITSGAWISLTQYYTKTEQTKVVDHNDEVVIIQKNTPYIRVNIVRAHSRSVISQLQYLIPRLLTIYQSQKKVFELGFLKSIDQNIINVLNLSLKKDDKGRKVDGRKISRIDRMKEIAPDLIVKDYARACQCDRQPIIIPAEDVAKWQSKSIIISGQSYPRQILPFPPSNPKWYFVCPGDKWPFPGLRKNKLSNASVYPFVPCCFKKDQMNPKSNSWYNEIYNGIPRKTASKKQIAGHVIKTDKLLDFGRTGQLPIMVTNLLKLHNDKLTYIRNGVERSPNSLLHCIYTAFRDPSYFTFVDPYLRESFIIQKRKEISAQLRNSGTASLLKQELYDFSDEEIYRQIENENIFFDPSLYYRILEEMFNINIYVFNVPSTSKGEFSKIEVPRHKKFHTRPYRKDRHTMLIFKHWGSESDKLTYPQCEYISSIDIPSQFIQAIFPPTIDIGSIQGSGGNIQEIDSSITSDKGSSINSLMYDALTNTNKTITWSLDPRNYQPIARSNIFTSFNILEIFAAYKQSIYGQYIDSYGKMRGLAFILDKEVVSIFFPPSQPENYKQITSNLDEIYQPKLESVLSLFNIEPTMIVLEDEIIIGLWYPILDIETGIYIPINKEERNKLDSLSVDTKFLSEHHVGPNHTFFTKGVNQVRRLRTLLRNRRIILEILRWVFILSGLDSETFIGNYIITSSKDHRGTDSSMVYTFDNFPRILPEFIKDSDQAIAYLEQRAPSLIEDGKIAGYTQKFTDGLMYFIKEYEKTTEGLRRKVPNEIKGMFQDEYDFNFMESTIIFVGESSMKSWLTSLVHLGVEVSKIKKKIDISDGLIQYPYLYKSTSLKNHNDEMIYMIQNVQGGDFRGAINVAYQWYLHGKNPGFGAELYENSQEYPPFMLYGISVSGDMVLIKDNSGGEENYLMLLSYGSGDGIGGGSGIQQYAAVLPML